jgi:ribosome-associated protein
MVKTNTIFRSLAIAAARAADEKKAEHLVILDVRKTTTITDYLIIMTATSPPHIQALIEEIEKAFIDTSVRALRREGRRDSLWQVIDFGGIIVHVMHHEIRHFYGLDKLWQEAKKISWLKK